MYYLYTPYSHPTVFFKLKSLIIYFPAFLLDRLAFVPDEVSSER